MNKLTLTIEYDESPLNPRKEFDNACTIYDFTGRNGFVLGGNDESRDSDNPFFSLANDLGIDHCYENDNVAFSMCLEYADIIPLRFYGRNKCNFEIGRFNEFMDNANGFIVLTKDKAAEELILDPEKHIKAELSTFEAYLKGEIYGYVIKDGNDDIIDSCWGYYDADYCEQEGQATLKHLEQSTTRIGDYIC